ncbi:MULTISPECIES: LutB/LldF family L-lactate oxidation iron-sulfur protein [unclassified Oceanobacter]|jgi:L-lactate dehydrogenase complex protein LldF|uniref:LutB/LldF family L-lactate oxidation iron-sulfur protein n=1 Tax=unclassified Oceanobacter TaxID=2620260 RepID=UPI002732EE51|nr:MULTISPECIES: LutB/LldF family L-lactate oxidation iron-sulfur protein [unclassified Oceanobacter]MDP2506192.1 LutB/LldF family L-lactate oxidation iron-sulfur protein [Oceanobacter sp. 3_MG-2023]MDP2607391.1 LutB/LldF family L-lactate oxidation iron-sulfur protein [Oceanobacter sp. 1_MG-2023]MDP2610659.1 LutB/LldF family L-lactate oxidation iron-sulfur protein [Oceanobacter sp. 2_MG-2023]
MSTPTSTPSFIELTTIVDQEDHDFADMQSRHFKARAKMSLENDTLRASFRGASDFLMGKRKSVFPDDEELEALRDRGEAARQRSLANLPDLLEQLETNLVANGIQVHWAETADEANRIIHGILDANQARTVVKGKSMVSEEIELNHYLEARGIECLESDMGEYLVQLAHEAPSHIVMPVIHKNKQQIARLMHTRATTPDGEAVPYSEDVDDLIGNARAILRQKFQRADAGISGVNMAIAETGTLLLVENEGNGRMCTTAPPLHIAVTGIEKVVQGLSDVPELLTLLPRSATGQLITTYVNMISGPRQKGELDGPEQVHLVLVDNGRSKMFNHPNLQPTLQCIRCGACMNHCPVYARVGGHAYGSTYPGPIGQVVTPQLGSAGGLAANGDMINACSLNGACGEACPVRIPLPDLIRNLRAEAVAPVATQQNGQPHVNGTGSQRSLGESLIWQGWSLVHKVPFLYRSSTRVMTRGRGLMPGKLAPWTNTRSMPKPAARSLHELARAADIPSVVTSEEQH